jgi:hypothetical protein
MVCLAPGKQPLLPIENGPGWALEPIWILLPHMDSFIKETDDKQRIRDSHRSFLNYKVIHDRAATNTNKQNTRRKDNTYVTSVSFE